MQRNSRKNTAGASKRNGIRANRQRERRNQCRCGRQPKWPPQKRPEEAARGRNSSETTAGASKCNGIRAKPQRETFRNGIRAKPQRGRRNQGPVPPPRAPLRSATNSFTLNVRTPLCEHCLGNHKEPKPYTLTVSSLSLLLLAPFVGSSEFLPVFTSEKPTKSLGFVV